MAGDSLLCLHRVPGSPGTRIFLCMLPQKLGHGCMGTHMGYAQELPHGSRAAPLAPGQARPALPLSSGMWRAAGLCRDHAAVFHPWCRRKHCGEGWASREAEDVCAPKAFIKSDFTLPGAQFLGSCAYSNSLFVASLQKLWGHLLQHLLQ